MPTLYTKKMVGSLVVLLLTERAPLQLRSSIVKREASEFRIEIRSRGPLKMRAVTDSLARA